MYDIFGKYGAIRQIRLGNAAGTKVRVDPVQEDLNGVKSPCLSHIYSTCTGTVQGTAFVVYEDIYDAKNACAAFSVVILLLLCAKLHALRRSCDHLSGFNVCNRYLIVLYYQVERQFVHAATQPHTRRAYLRVCMVHAQTDARVCGASPPKCKRNWTPRKSKQR
eukprot:COSAG01_NODE_408_length_17382_cov_6.231431_7_plen_164_part_00